MSKIFHYCKYCGSFIRVEKKKGKKQKAKCVKIEYCSKKCEKKAKNSIDNWL